MKRTLAHIAIIALFICTSVACVETNHTTHQTTAGSGEVIALTQEEFVQVVFDYKLPTAERKYKGDKPAIVDFYAPWCGPCKMVAPIMEELAKEYAGQIIVYKVDIDSQTALAKALDIQTIPAVLFIPLTGKTETVQGFRPKFLFTHKVNNLLLK
ncbi:MAG: thioredoxin domain-containing protein [Alistipes sp.]